MANDDTAVEKQEENADSQNTTDTENVQDDTKGDSSKVEEEGAGAGGDEAEVEKEASQGSDEQIGILEAEIEALKQKAEDNWNKFLLEKAEGENIRRRAQRDVDNARNFAIERFVQDLLPVQDSLEMGLAASIEKGADIAKLREGTKLTLKMFADTVAKFGVEVVDPLNKPFNPEFHQAMSIQESDKKPNMVLSVMQKGYLLNGRLIRPAMVVVSKAKAKAEKGKDKKKNTDKSDESTENGTNIDDKA